MDKHHHHHVDMGDLFACIYVTFHWGEGDGWKLVVNDTHCSYFEVSTV